MSQKLISVVVPVFGEAPVLEEFYRRLSAALQTLESYRYEIIVVDDGSPDASLNTLKAIAQHDLRVKIISLSRNFGHQIAITAGMHKARGDAVILMDADLQDPPELIRQFVRLWEAGNDVVYGTRIQRRGESWFKKTTASVFYKALNRLSDVKIPSDAGDFRLLDHRVVQEINRLREHDRFLRGLVSWVGFKQAAVEYVRQPRFAGQTKFSLWKMIHFALDGVVSFSNKPLRLALNLGFLSILVAFAVLAYGLIMFTLGNTIRGWTSTMVTILFLGGVQLFTLGIIGEYLGRIHKEIKRRPLYVVDEEINFDFQQKPDPANFQPRNSTNHHE